jgi:serine/threonine protein kinase
MIAAEPELLPEGSELAPGYIVLQHVSRGRVYDVYEVWSAERSCRCAAKTLRPDVPVESRARRGLVEEGRRLEQLTHPNVVRAYDLIEDPNTVLILEALPGMTLEYWLEEQGRLAVADLVHLGEHLCSAIAYLHRRGLVHLDLKPGNLLCSFGIVRVVDLSLARPPGRIEPGVGTHVYLAPEQARGGWVGEPADVWGIGIVLWEAATGRPLFERSNADPDGYPQLERRAPPVRGLRHELPPALADAVDSSLAPEPAARPAVCELAGIVESLLRAPPPTTERP